MSPSSSAGFAPLRYEYARDVEVGAYVAYPAASSPSSSSFSYAARIRTVSAHPRPRAPSPRTRPPRRKYTTRAVSVLSARCIFSLTRARAYLCSFAQPVLITVVHLSCLLVNRIPPLSRMYDTIRTTRYAASFLVSLLIPLSRSHSGSL